MKRISLAWLVVGLWLPAAYGVDVIIVDEDFESYANDSALFNEWFDNGQNNYGLVDETLFPDAYPEGGQGVEHVGGIVMDWLGFDDPVQQPPISPSETQSVVVRGDVFDDGLGNTANKRMTIGLRNFTNPNILELGFYNSNSCDPTVCGPGQAGGTSAPQNAVEGDPGFYLGTGYSYRMQLFAGIADPLLVQPDWQYFQLPQELDRPQGDPPEPNGIINSFDVGPGWHRYQATITPTEITVEIDLFRDGLRNTSITPDAKTGIRPGTPGVDASVTWPVISNAVGYDSLRIGGPSNLSSAGGGLVYDNLYLALVDVPVGVPGDYNENGVVDAADYTVWRDLLGQSVTLPNEDPGTTPGMVTQEDYTFWKSAFGNSGSGSGALGSVAVPEPSAGALSCIAVAGFGFCLRRRSVAFFC